MNDVETLVKKWFNSKSHEHDAFMRNRFAYHRSHPLVSIEVYRHRLLHKLGTIVSKKTIVYLDQKYWLNLRDVFRGINSNKDYADLLDLLIAKVETGLFICPLSFWHFEELLKQADRETRKATAQMIDRLSNGISFVTHRELVQQEALHFIRKYSTYYKNVKDIPIRECIWTRIMSFLGSSIPVWPDSIPAANQLIFQKVMEDFSFFVPFEGVVEIFRNSQPSSVRVGYNVQEINQRRKTVRNEHKTFKSLFLAELAHSIKENEEHLLEAIRYLAVLALGEEGDFDVNKVPDEKRNEWRSLIYALFEKSKVTNELPSYHIPAILYAALFWDERRDLRDNDVFDIYHAQTGIPFCDYFLTEHSLRTLACGNNVALDKVYNTGIISDPKAACERLAGLGVKSHSNPQGAALPLLTELFNSASTGPTAL